MKWNAYINRRINGTNEYHTEVIEFELPNTTASDKSYACLHASEIFDVPEDTILCLPKRDHLPDRPYLGERLCQWHSSMGDPVYAVGSFYVDDKKYPDKTIVEDAIRNLRSDRDDFVRMRKGEKVGRYNEHYGRWIDDQRAFAGYTDEQLGDNIDEINQILIDLTAFLNHDYK
jgi:hypothetical protein